MTKVFVFDTNSIISANLLHGSITMRAYKAAYEHGVIVYSKDTLSEFAKTFARSKFDKYIDPNKRSDVILAFENENLFIDVSISINACRDPKDNKFLELAVTAEAGYIITGDKDLLVLHPFRNIAILTPGDFLRSLSDESPA